MKFIHIVGARPNFMKVAPVHQAIATSSHQQLLVHSGQHYDKQMSELFFQQLQIPAPEINLGIGSDTHARQTANIMIQFEPIVENYKPDWALVYGDINTTVAAALVASKLQIPVAHIEAGLRSFDRTMPEELNRLVTDQLSDLLLTPSPDADENLIKEGVKADRIVRVGNIMIDTLLKHVVQARKSFVNPHPQGYLLVTLHRPSNVDDAPVLKRIMQALGKISEWLPVIFPVHPRTLAKLDAISFDNPQYPNVHLSPPLGYLEFLGLMDSATAVATDSGGIQEETTALGIPCLTLRENTERPITITQGTNTLIGHDYDRLIQKVAQYAQGHRPVGKLPDLWDGQTAHRILQALEARK